MNDNLDALILKIEARSATELKKHTAGPGMRYVFSDHRNNPQGNIYSIMRVVKDVNEPAMHVEMHSHTCDSLVQVIGDNDDLTGLTIEVFLGEKKYLLQSPGAAYIPAGVVHSYRLVKGSGKYMNIVLAQGGEYNTTIQK